VLFVSLRDLQWRRRRFLIGVLATGLVFALALVITGISGSFNNEVSRTVHEFHADAWVVSEKASGPFTSTTLLPASLEANVRAQAGVRDAAAVLITRFSVQTSSLRDIGLIGIEPDHVGAPKLHDGRPIGHAGEAIVDRALGVKVGRVLTIGATPFRVVGRTSCITYFGGQPVVFVTLGDAQRLAVANQPLATAIVVRGQLAAPVPGTHMLTNPGVVTDLRRPLKAATGTVSILRTLLWIVAAGIIALILYLQALERTRDFAVFKATGVTGRSLAVGLAFQAIVLACLSVVVAVVLAIVLAPAMPMPVETPASAFALLPVVAVVIGVLASLFGLRRAVTVDPALAFGGA